MNSTAEVSNQLPSVILYALCIGFGVGGNIAVISIIGRVLWFQSNIKINHIYVYIVALSCADLLFCLCGCFVLSYMAVKKWILGWFICKLTFLSEGLNKTLSVHLLVVLSADRYLAICHPLTSSPLRSIRAAVIILLIVCSIAFLINIPIVMFTEYAYISQIGAYRCGLRFPQIYAAASYNTTVEQAAFNHIGEYYTLILTVIYFLVPACLISMSYCKIIAKLRSTNLARQKIRSWPKRVNGSILAIVLFYFLCWTPYWTFLLLVLFAPYTGYSDALVTAATWIYLLPYINAAMNPFFYTALNRQLRQSYRDTIKDTTTHSKFNFSHRLHTRLIGKPQRWNSLDALPRRKFGHCSTTVTGSRDSNLDRFTFSRAHHQSESDSVLYGKLLQPKITITKT